MQFTVNTYNNLYNAGMMTVGAGNYIYECAGGAYTRFKKIVLQS